MFNDIENNDRYPLFFASKTYVEVSEFLKNKNAFRLFSYVNEKRDLEKHFEDNYKVFVDSGAFSAMTRGIEIDIDEYIDFLNANSKNILLMAQFDTIPYGNISPEESAQKTWDNYLYMRDRIHEKHKLLYVFHYGEPIEYLERILNQDEDVEYIAFGGVAKRRLKEREEFFEKCFEVIKRSKRPNIKTHAFGMTSFSLLEKYPITSCDSTSWLWKGKFGGVHTPNGIIYVSERTKDKSSHINNISEEKLQTFIRDISKYGQTLETIKLKKNVHKYHICQLIEWAEDFKKRMKG